MFKRVKKEMRFSAWLHRSYHQGSSLGHFIKHRVTPLGWTLLGSCLFTGLFATDMQRSQAYQLFSILLALVLISFIWTWFRRAKLEAKRLVPTYVTAKEPFHYRIQLTNLSKRAVRGLGLMELGPDPRPSLERFHYEREPWEEERNGFDRRMAFYRWRWLCDAAEHFSEKRVAELAVLEGSGEVQVDAQMTLERRGVVMLKDLRAVLPDPIGCFQRLRRISGGSDKVIVLPKRYRIPEQIFEGSSRNQVGGESASNQSGQSAEYMSVRDYRPGDPLRHIHWKGWARTGKPAVLEFEEAFFPRYGLILDTRASVAESALFEIAVSIAASFASKLETRESLIDLMFLEDRAVHLAAGRGEARSDELLETLAGVESSVVTDYSKLERLVGRYSDQLSSAYFTMAGWDAERAGLCAKLMRTGLDLTIFPVFKNQASSKQQLAEFPTAARVIPIHLTSVQLDLQKAI